MKKRTISAIILVTILVVSFLNSKSFGIIMSLISVLGFSEFFDIKYKDKLKELFTIKILGIICLILITLNKTFYIIDIELLILIPILIFTIPVIFYNNSKLYSIIDSFYILGIIYLLGISFGNIIYLRTIDKYLCLFIFIIAFITDTYAYIGGSLIGKHTFTSISPKKTIEGCLIGLIMGIIIGSTYYFNIIGGITIIESIILCLILVILSEIGDLIFSSIKRYFSVKDFSNLIPGHGGILDRFDSIIYVSLGLYLMIMIM